jgi:hypothetical protein
VLAVAGGFSAVAAFEIVGAEKMENVGGFEVGDFVCLTALVDEKGEIDAGFLLEESGVVGVAEADGGEGGVFGAEGLLVFAQLRDVLAAEDSAVVTEKDEDGGVVFPEGAEADGVAEGVGKGEGREAMAE